MARIIFLAMLNPSDGNEDELTDWYVQEHLEQIVKVEGVVSGQILRYIGVTSEPLLPVPGNYLALYEIETDGPPEQILERMYAMVESGAINYRADLIGDIDSWMFAPISDIVTDGS